MGKRYDSIPPELQAFIEEQSLFFVATAPLAGDGHVNLSPKGLDTFRMVGPREVMYLDLTGSGNETAAHVAENGRLTLMFCAFQGRPKIVRLYCRGRIITRKSARWDELAGNFPSFLSARQIIIGEVEFVQSSCGFGVPEMVMAAERDMIQQWAETKGAEGIAEYRRTRNTVSLDGLPAPTTDPEGDVGRENIS